MASVLIVEDDPLFSSMLVEIFSQKGISCAIAVNGRNALELLRGTDLPHVIILDLGMPVMGGKGFLEERSKELSMKLIPVLVCSNEIESLPLELRANVSAYLEKSEYPAIVRLAEQLVIVGFLQKAADA